MKDELRYFLNAFFFFFLACAPANQISLVYKRENLGRLETLGEMKCRKRFIESLLFKTLMIQSGSGQMKAGVCFPAQKRKLKLRMPSLRVTRQPAYPKDQFEGVVVDYLQVRARL